MGFPQSMSVEPETNPTPKRPKRVLPPLDPEATLALLREMREIGDPEEQRETWEFLKRALDEDRFSGRTL